MSCLIFWRINIYPRLPGVRNSKRGRWQPLLRFPIKVMQTLSTAAMLPDSSPSAAVSGKKSAGIFQCFPFWMSIILAHVFKFQMDPNGQSVNFYWSKPMLLLKITRFCWWIHLFWGFQLQLWNSFAGEAPPGVRAAEFTAQASPWWAAFLDRWTCYGSTSPEPPGGVDGMGRWDYDEIMMVNDC